MEQSPSPPAFFENALKAFQQGNPEQAFRILAAGIIGKEDAWDELRPGGRRILLDNARSAQAELALRDDRPAFTCEDAQSIRVPTLLLQGERTLKIMRLATQEMRQCMPDSEHAVLPDASHALQLENPADFNRIVLDFLTRHFSRARADRIGRQRHPSPMKL